MATYKVLIQPHGDKRSYWAVVEAENRQQIRSIVSENAEDVDIWQINLVEKPLNGIYPLWTLIAKGGM